MRAHLFLAMLCLALGTFSSPVKRDEVTTIENDVKNIDTETKALDTVVIAFPNSGGSILQALNIHEAALTLDQAVKDATSDATGGAPLSETNGNAVLDLVDTLVPDIQQTLSNLVSKKAALTDLPIGGVTSIVLSDLQTLEQDSGAYIQALLAITPAALVNAAEAQATLVKNAFTSAINAYS